MATHKVTRRTFIAGTGALLGAHLLSGCVTPAPTQPPAAPVDGPPGEPPAPATPADGGFPIAGQLLTAPPAEAGEREVQQVVYNSPLDYSAGGGEQITAFGESPVWANMVANGELPPVEERLPVEPIVVQPEEGIGLYGGYMTTAILGETTLIAAGVNYLNHLDPLTNISPQGDTIPNIIHSWEIS